MSEFCHLILTQFNVKIDSESEIRVGPEWLSYRFDLFERFCYPSIRGQTNQHFKWLVFFDLHTPNIFREKVESYARWNNFVPCYVDSFSNLENHDIIRENISPDSKYIITTRIDNDDAVSTDFVDKIQKNFYNQRLEFINFTNGYLLDCNKHKLYKKRIFSNMFISLIESVENFKTVFCAVPCHTGPQMFASDSPWLSHINLHLVGKIREIEAEPLWLIVVHGRNLDNKIWLSALRVPIQLLDNRFKINYAYDPDSSNLFISNMIKKIGLSLPKPIKSSLKNLYFMLGTKK